MSEAADCGILDYGVYVPRLRLQRQAIYAANAWFAPALRSLAKGERAIANWDEDPVTMAVEAARASLEGRDRASIRALSLASTTLPFADRSNAGVVKEALALADEVSVVDATGCQRAATSALRQALENGATRLCVGSDLRRARPASEAELLQGDAAGAVLVGRGPVIARLLGSHAVTVDFVDHFRASGARFDYAWENRWIRDEGYLDLLGGALQTALGRWRVPPTAIDRLLIAVPGAGVGQQLARAAGVRPEAVADTLGSVIGDTGVAHPLVMLAAALDAAQPGERILLAAFGQGCDLLLFQTTDELRGLARGRVAAALAAGKSDDNYLRFLFHRGLIELDRGMRAEQDHKQPGTTLYRNRKAVFGLIGGRNPHSGVVQFPRSDIGVDDPEHRIGVQEEYPLAERKARIVSYTADSLTYCPAPPNWYGLVDFEGGGRLLVEFADVEAEEIEVGRPMRMVFRIKALDEVRGFRQYFWKATPVRTAAAAGS